MPEKNQKPKMPRFLHVIDTLDRRSGGPVAGVATLADHAESDGIEIEVVSLDLPDDECVRDFPVKAYGLGERHWFNRLVPKFRYSSKIVPWLKENAGNYDAIVVNGIWCYHTLAAGRALRAIRKPYVVFTHGMLDPWFKRAYPLKHLKKQLYWTLFLGKVLRDSRFVLFTAEDERLLARGAFIGYAPPHERVVSYGPNDVPAASQAQIEAFRKTVPNLGDRPFLLFLSRIHPKKGCDLLVEAFGKAASGAPSLQLVIAGPDPDNMRSDLDAMAQKYGVADRIHWAGMVSGDAKWGAFRAADAFILPSHQENFGIAVAEALACGTPVLISDKINIWREIVGAGAGLVANNDVAGTQGLITRFMALTADERRRMSEQARTCFLNNFCGDRFAEDMLKVCRDLNTRS